MQSMHAKQTVQQKCFAVLKDLETTYIDLSKDHKQDGVGHNNPAFAAQFLEEEVATREQAYAMACGMMYHLMNG